MVPPKRCSAASSRSCSSNLGGTSLDTRTNLQGFFYFFKDHNLVIGLVQPTGRIRIMDHYDEFYEQYRTTNLVAAPRAALAR